MPQLGPPENRHSPTFDMIRGAKGVQPRSREVTMRRSRGHCARTVSLLVIGLEFLVPSLPKCERVLAGEIAERH